jgi:hypothetical protein
MAWIYMIQGSRGLGGSRSLSRARAELELALLTSCDRYLSYFGRHIVPHDFTVLLLSYLIRVGAIR